MLRLPLILVLTQIVDTHKQKHLLSSVWNYDDERGWPGIQCQVGGARQSPIDIRRNDVIWDYRLDVISEKPLELTGYQLVLVSGINNGHTILLHTEGDEVIHPVVTGGPLQHNYRLEQVHFHWLSEHSIDGNKFPMEIHFVHIRNDLTVEKALKQGDGLCILAVFSNVQADVEEEEFLQREELMQHLPRLIRPGDRNSGLVLDLTKLLPRNLQSYYTYEGSLTSPECNEAVIWIIFNDPIIMSDTQYRMFGKVGVGRHNFRSLRSGSQKVYAKPRSYIRRPVIVSAFDEFWEVLKRILHNATYVLSRL